jgi:hypothetical protein
MDRMSESLRWMDAPAEPGRDGTIVESITLGSPSRLVNNLARTISLDGSAADVD